MKARRGVGEVMKERNAGFYLHRFFSNSPLSNFHYLTFTYKTKPRNAGSSLYMVDSRPGLLPISSYNNFFLNC